MNNKLAEEYFDKGMEMYKSERYFAAVKYWKEAAEYGHVTAMYNMGILYLNGQGVSQDGGEAFDYFLKAAEEGDNDAVYQIGRCFELGMGVDKDLSKACEAYEIAADEGHEKAKERLEALRSNKANQSEESPFASDDILFDMYNEWMKEGKPEPLVNWSFEKTEELNKKLSIAAGDGLANRYRQQITTNSPTKQSTPNAQDAEMIARLGINYLHGIHVEKDFERAYNCFKIGVENGCAVGYYGLGMMYYSGYYVKEDMSIAFRYFEKASNLGHKDATMMLGAIYHDGLGTPKNYHKAFRIFQQLALKGDGNGYYFLASMYEHGEGVRRDRSKAAQLYRVAANMGDEQASKKYNELSRFINNPLAQAGIDIIKDQVKDLLADIISDAVDKMLDENGSVISQFVGDASAELIMTAFSDD